MMDLYGLIGRTLKHSFSQKYFRKKFSLENIANKDYLLFELLDITEFPALLKNYPALLGLNVTIPYKQDVIKYIHTLHPKAKEIGAVNTIKIGTNGLLTGYNTDYFGFKQSLETWLKPPFEAHRALVLGSGGASKAVIAALKAMNILYTQVSRTAGAEMVSYASLHEGPSFFDSHTLIVNTTPLGTSPNIDEAPLIPYEQLSEKHYLYDLVYNPTETLFLKRGKEKGARTKNGLEMLELQAEKAWEIWNSEEKVNEDL